MACCGRRSGWTTTPERQHGEPAPVARAAAQQAPVEFEYVGPTAMTVTGGGSGRRYRFAATGARLVVDASDAAAFAGVPNLRRRRAA
jgi:hypothetical protein